MIERPTVPHIFESIAAILVVAILYFQWQEGKQQALQFAETVKSQQVLLVQAQQQTAALQKDIASRDLAAQTQIEALKSQVVKLQTPAQISPWLAETLNKQIATATGKEQAPITINVPPSTSAAPVTASIPQSDMQAVRDLVSQAQQNAASLKACTSDKADLISELTAKDQEVKAANTERDAALKLAKGGSRWHRVVQAFKYVGIGIGVGVIFGAKKL